MKKLLLVAFIISLSANSFGQISHGGEPIRWEGKSSSNVPFKKLRVDNLEEYRAEDLINDQNKSIPYRFGVNVEVDLSSAESGLWTDLSDGSRVWRMGIDMPNALTINFIFDVYDVPEGGEVFIYTPNMDQVIGKFTSENESDIGSLGVGLIPSEKIIIEYYEPAETVGQGYLHINQVTYGYREGVLRLKGQEKAGPFGNSGACNIDVNCADIALYDFQKRSVALYVANGNSICSGALVNNTLQDQHPFFLTANHCPFGSASNFVFYFNHEVPECGGSDDDAPTDFTVSGSTVLASSSESDFGLLELDNNVPAFYNVCYSGWDATDSETSVMSAYGIHHPGGDVKKICFDEDAPYHDLGTAGFVNQTWFIDEWEEGTTEGGSSGSPLFNQNGMIIGQLSGGSASCSNTDGFDFYGRIGIAWDYGSTPETRLRDWLDPAETGQLIIPNSCASEAPENDITLGAFSVDQFLFCDLETINESIAVVNTGSNDITSFTLGLSINGEVQDNIEWSDGTIESFQSEFIDIGEIQLIEGDNTVVVEVILVNDGNDANDIGNQQTNSYVATGAPLFVDLTIQFDDFPTETSWRIIDENENTYYSGGGYSENANLLQEELCFPEGCYTFIIEDSWGDGICCGQGEGYYLLQNENLDTLAIGGEFDDEAIELFCAEPLSTRENSVLNTIAIYPNPASNFVNINFGDAQRADQILVTDLLGRVVANETGNALENNNVRIETSSFQTGVYLIQIQTEFGTATRKVVIE